MKTVTPAKALAKAYKMAIQKNDLTSLLSIIVLMKQNHVHALEVD